MRYLKGAPKSLYEHHSYTPAASSSRDVLKTSNKKTDIPRSHHYVPTVSKNKSDFIEKTQAASLNRSNNYVPTTFQGQVRSNADTGKEPVVGRKHNYVPTTFKGQSSSRSNIHTGNESAVNNRSHNYVPTTFKSQNGKKTIDTGRVAQPPPSPQAPPKPAPAPKPLPGRKTREQEQKEAAAALKIQAVARGAKSREKTNREKIAREKARAALKLQAFVRGAMCRARVSQMLLELIEGLMAEKAGPQQEIDEEEVYEEVYEEIVEQDDHGVFDALEEDHDIEEDFEEAVEEEEILDDTGDVNGNKSHKKVKFVDKENQVIEIERAWKKAQIPQWWMDYVPHANLDDDEVDEAYAIIPPAEWPDEELEAFRHGRESTPSTPHELSSARTNESDVAPDMIVDLAPKTDTEPVPEPEPEPAQSEMIESQVEEANAPAPDSISTPPRSNVKSLKPTPTPETALSTQASYKTPTSAGDEATGGSLASKMKAFQKEEPSGPLADRMKAFQQGNPTPSKRNFKVASFR